MRRFLLVVVAFIVYGSLYPFHFDFARTTINPFVYLLSAWPATIDKFALRDAAVNLLLYFPLGLALFLTLVRGCPRVVAMALAIGCGLCLSASMEMLQIYDGSRTCSMADLLCNLVGASVGVFVAIIFQPHIEQFARRHGREPIGGALLLAASWTAFLLYPFIPILSRGRLHATFLACLATRVAPVELFATSAEWFAFAMILQAITRRMHPGFLTLAMLAVPLRMLILDQAVTPADFLGAGLALLLYWVLPGGRWRVLCAAGLLATAIVLRELTPFQFTAATHHFSWMPFAATLNAKRQNAAPILFRKAFDYGATIWLLCTRGFKYPDAGISVALALFLLEWLQRHIPGHQPEITDAVVAIVLAGLLWSLHPRRGLEPVID
jgi:VanZ family protein